MADSYGVASAGDGTTVVADDDVANDDDIVVAYGGGADDGGGTDGGGNYIEYVHSDALPVSIYTSNYTYLHRIEIYL